MNSILKVRDINKTFQNIKAVNNISFDLEEGEILGLLGPNGAGKTTIIRMIMDIFEPDQGTISINKNLINNQKQIGYLPEERGIYDSTKVLQTILYFADLKGMKIKEAEKEALNWLEKFNLLDYKNKKVEDLSRGMQQKVQFIISVIHKPKLIILDEVFSGLDPVNQEMFKDIIKKLLKENTTILLSSHRMNLVEEVCNKIFMINQGKRVLYGDINTIKDNYNEKKVLIKTNSEINFIKKLNYVTELEIVENEVSFNVKGNIDVKTILSSLSEKIIIDEISITKPPLHEIFINTIRGGKK